MNTYEVVLAITSYAYIEIEATDPTEAMRIGAEEWESHKHEADNPELTGIGWTGPDDVTPGPQHSGSPRKRTQTEPLSPTPTTCRSDVRL